MLRASLTFRCVHCKPGYMLSMLSQVPFYQGSDTLRHAVHAAGQRPQRGRMEALRVPEECPAEVAELFQRCVSVDPQARPAAR